MTLTYDDLAEGLRYDPASQVTQILHQLTATSAQINQAAYAYNPVGNRTSLTDRRGAQAFGYDTLDRLTSASHLLLATPQAFAYDPVGNRTTGGSVVNAGNQLTADSNFAYQYDDNGNLTRKTLLATGNFTAYTYDAENRLTKVEDFAAGNPTATATSIYRYDGLGRRIEKVGNGITRRYVYDGEDILLEYDGANVLQARYTHGPGIDEPIAVTKGSSTFFYHQDGQGTVTDLTDSSGTTAKSYAYDAHGNILESPGTLDQPYTYTGREFDSESGLSYYRARYYDPTSGRFLQEDPISFLGGDFNLYAYVRNNPLRYTDALGLAPRKPNHASFPDYNLPGGYGARVDPFNTSGGSSFEIHVCDAAGNEIGVYGPDGWINKHGKGIPTAVSKGVNDALKGIAVDELRARGKIPAKGRANIKGNNWRKNIGKGCTACGIAGAAIGAGAALADGSSAADVIDAASEPFVCPFGCDEAY